MNRVNLLSTDQSSSEVKMTITGLSTPSGSTRTKAAKGLFSHFMFLSSLLLIALLTSGKVMAQEPTTYTVTLEGSNISITEGTTVSMDNRVLTLVPAAGFKLPAVEAITVSKTGGAEITKGTASDNDKWSYADGVITLGSEVELTNGITITASGVKLKDIATLKSLTYQIGASGAENVTGFSQDATAGTFTVALAEYTSENITVTGVVTDDSNAQVSDPVTVTAAVAVTDGVTITVTPEDQSTPAEYVVKFTMPQDKLNAITVPEALTSLTLENRMTEEKVLAYLGENYATFAITTVGEQSDLTLAVVWTLKEGTSFSATPGGTNAFTWSVAKALEDANLDQNSKELTGDVTITNAAASDKTVISSLTYTIGKEGQPTAVTADLTGTGAQTYAVELPYGTATDASITVNIACDDNATAKLSEKEAATEFSIQLSAGKASLALVITAEDGSTTRNVTINFTIAEELVTAVSGVPANYTLSEAVADEKAAIALLDAMDMKNITLTANSKAPLKLKWEYSGGSFQKGSGQSNNFTWTVVKEDGSQIAANQGVTATGTTAVTNYTVSTEAGISALTYQVAGGSIETIASVKEDPATNDVTVAYGTKSITVSITPTDAKATVSLTDKPEDHGTLIEGVTSYETPVVAEFKFTITAEDGSTAKNFIIKLTIDKEKITEVTVPDTYKLPEAVKDEAGALVLLAKMEGVVIKTNGTTPMKLSWTYDKNLNNSNAYAAAGGKTNLFSWSAVRDGEGDALEAATGVTIQGTMTVTNFMEPVTGDKSNEDVKITTDNPVDKIGDGQTPTTVKSVDIAEGVTADQLTINKASIGKLDLKGSVDEVVLKEATIPEVVLAKEKTTTLTLQSGNKIDKITNAGTLVLQNAETTSAVAALSMAIETRATVVNKGAVGTVVNNGVFTDKTATIVTVDGATDLTITSQPASTSTTGSKATLSVTATTENGNLSYQWQKSTSAGWEAISSSTKASLEINKTANGSTQYRCEVKSTNSTKVTTLYTPAVTVRFYTESTPGEPSNPSTPTYTVSFDKVAGATFSKGEKTTVDAGDSFSFKITLDKDYDQSKPIVTVDGKAITADADGSYTIKNIQTDIKIVVSGIVKNTATGIEDTVEDAARAWTVGSTSYIHVPETSDVYVVSGTGALQQQLRGVSGDYNMQLRAGFYIVRIGEVLQKVIIR